jgi:hypothetical protein
VDRALVSGTKGRAFESRIAHHNKIKHLCNIYEVFFDALKTAPSTIPPRKALKRIRCENFKRCKLCQPRKPSTVNRAWSRASGLAVNDVYLDRKVFLLLLTFEFFSLRLCALA